MSFVLLAAESGVGAVKEAFTDGFGLMVTDLIDMVTGILPMGLTIFGVSVGVAYAIKFIKNIVK